MPSVADPVATPLRAASAAAGAAFDNAAFTGAEFGLAAAAVLLALALRPWRSLPADGPPWPWLAWCAVLPLFWGADRWAAMPLAPPLSGVPLLVLMAGWPAAMLATLPVAGALVALEALDVATAAHRYVWLAVLPGSFAVAVGLAMRRLMPRHLFVYILGRGFLATWLTMACIGAANVAASGGPPGTDPADAMLARFLAAAGEAFLTGMFTAIFVAFRPQWLATYTDRLYLPTSR